MAVGIASTQVLGLVEELASAHDEGVPYPRIVTKAQREYHIGRPDAVETVEALVEEGRLEKVDADRIGLKAD